MFENIYWYYRVVVRDDASCIDDPKFSSAPFDNAENTVTSNAGLIADNRLARAREAIEKRRFADIWPADYGDERCFHTGGTILANTMYNLRSMEFELDKAVEVLRQTPYTLARMLGDLSDEWTASDGDEDDWAPYDVIGHLIHGEETDWIPRAEIILAQGDDRTFVPFDRFAQFERSEGKSLDDLLTEFAHLRNANIEKLIRWELTSEKLVLKGVHPDFGEVTLSQLLATWVVHDLNHVRQIVTIMARRYADNVGPWKAYTSILS